MFDRAKRWLTETFAARFEGLLLQTAAREQLVCPVYCLMPDHIHLVWMGLARVSDQRKGMAFLRTYLEPLLAPHNFQPQAHDRVLRDQERQQNRFAATCSYVLNNPVRAELARRPAEWPFTGAVIPGYPRMDPVRDANHSEKFWRIYY